MADKKPSQTFTTTCPAFEVTPPADGSKKYFSVSFEVPKEAKPEGFGKTPKLLVPVEHFKPEEFTEGDSGELVYEVSWDNDGKNSNWLKSWKGKEVPAYSGGNKKGGSGGYQKSFEEIHGTNICGIMKSNREAFAESLNPGEALPADRKSVV